MLGSRLEATNMTPCGLRYRYYAPYNHILMRLCVRRTNRNFLHVRRQRLHHHHCHTHVSSCRCSGSNVQQTLQQIAKGTSGERSLPHLIAAKRKLSLIWIRKRTQNA